MNVIQIAITLMIILPISVGCQHHTSFLFFNKQTDRPVMLGKVERIGGKSHQQGAKLHEFNLNNSYGRFFIYIAFSPKVADVDDTFANYINPNEELEKKFISQNDSVKVNEINFYSNYFCLLLILLNGCSSQGSTGIHGAIYSDI